jgi:hypothetical protein
VVDGSTSHSANEDIKGCPMPYHDDNGWTFGQAFILYAAIVLAFIAALLIGKELGWWW